MQIAREDLRKLANQATTIWERLEHSDGVKGRADKELAEKRIKRWREVIGDNGGGERLARRLAGAGLSLAAVKPVLARADFSLPGNLPPWAKRLEAILAGLPEKADLSRDLARVPFAHVLWPLVIFAADAAHGAAGANLLTVKAWHGLEKALLHVLAELARPALFQEFEAFIPFRQTMTLFGGYLRELLPVDPAAKKKKRSTVYYNAFVGQLLAGGLVEVLKKYPVLARQLVGLVDNWITNTAEFLGRLAADRQAIQRRFNDGQAIGPVQEIKSNLSDSHNGNKTVLQLTFDSGLKLIYKPKDFGVALAWMNLLAWLRKNKAPVDFKELRLIERPAYGWMEFVEYKGCRSEREIKQFYRRSGGLLCLLQAVGASDCHEENVIAGGAFPQLIDIETIMTPRLQYWLDASMADQAIAKATDYMGATPLQIGLLPFLMKLPDGKSFELGGLKVAAGDKQEHEGQRLININSDQMALARDKFNPPKDSNIPRLAGRRVGFRGYEEEIVQGFGQLYSFFLRHRRSFLAPNGPLQKFSGQVIRFVPRDTASYAYLLRHLRQAEFLVDGLDHSLELDAIARGFVPNQAPKKPGKVYWGFYATERRDLEGLDVPFFTARTDRRDLYKKDKVVAPGIIRESGIVSVKKNFANWNEAELKRQCDYIRSALYQKPQRQSKKVVSVDWQPVSTLKPAQSQAAAVMIAEQMVAQAFHGKDGSVTWFAPQRDLGMERESLGVITSPYLYDGLSGIAVFLAAVSVLTGEKKYRSLALAACATMRQLLDDFETLRRRSDFALGGMHGLGAAIYGLTRVGSFLGAGDLTKEALVLAKKIKAEDVEKDAALDVIGGAAGFILALLPLYEETHDAGILAVAQMAGQHLLASRRVDKSGKKNWRCIKNSQPLTGMAHGVSGIVLALLRLYAVTRDRKLLAAAKDGLAFERSVYVPEEKNWPDYRDGANKSSDKPAFMNGWCAGAPGIGLARLAGLNILDNRMVREDIAAAVAKTLATPVYQIDHVCCGNMGRVDFLISAAQILDQPDLRQKAAQMAHAILRRAKKQGHYALHSALGGAIFAPAFFQGTAGIGYTLLRLADPQFFPAVTSLE